MLSRVWGTARGTPVRRAKPGDTVMASVATSCHQKPIRPCSSSSGTTDWISSPDASGSGRRSPEGGEKGDQGRGTSPVGRSASALAAVLRFCIGISRYPLQGSCRPSGVTALRDDDRITGLV